jgi:hypothetical protein
VIFAVNSRITSIISDFLDLVEGSDLTEGNSPLWQAEQLCRDAQCLYDEWHLVSVEVYSKVASNNAI